MSNKFPTRIHLDGLEQQRVHRERNDCAVRALAVVAGVPYTVAHDALAKAGRKNRRGTSRMAQRTALKALGCRLEYVDHRKAGMLTYITLQRKNPPGRYLVYTSYHVAAYTGGKLHDYANKLFTRRRIQGIVRVIRPRKRGA